MASMRPNLVINPLFYEALSGEFLPPSDLEKRAHTLGRLAYAAFLKGKQILPHAPAGRAQTAYFRYKPSWAPTVEAELDCELYGNLYVARSFDITNREKPLQEWPDSVMIVDSLDQIDSPSLFLQDLINDDGGEAWMSDLAPKSKSLDNFRTIVAESAQNFFNHLEA